MPLAEEVRQVVLIGLSPSIAAHVMEPIRAVAEGAALQVMRPADLGSPQTFPEGTLLVVQDVSADEDGVATLRRLRTGGAAAPAILIVTGDDFEVPDDLHALGDLDVIPLSELSRYALRRSLVLLGARASRERLLEEVSGRLRAYERVLASKDEERLRMLDVASALERRLSATEVECQQNEAAWAERLARADGYVRELEERIAELEGGVDAASADASRRRRQLALELAFHREESLKKDAKLAALNKTSQEQAQELRRLTARQAQLNSLAVRLAASERVRSAQTRELLACNRRNGELESHLETIAALLEAEEGAASRDPEALLAQLAERLTRVERTRSRQQGTIDRLSHSLAVQQVDDTLDDAGSRRNAVRRVDEAVQRARRFDQPLICLMIGIDRTHALRRKHGSASFDFILVQVAHRLQLSLRCGDVVMRYGDGEFLLISDAKTVEAAESHALRLMRTVCAEPLELGGKKLEVSLSVAVLPYHRDMGDAPEVIRRARHCLLEAQARGTRQILVGRPYAVGTPPPGCESEPPDELPA